MVIKFGGLAPNDMFKRYWRIFFFLFGDMVRYRHTYNMHTVEILTDFYLAVGMVLCLMAATISYDTW